MHTLALAALLLATPKSAAPVETPVYVAVCREVREDVFPRGAGMRIELLAALEGGTLQPVELGVVRSPSPLVSRIGGLEWHFLAPDGSSGRAERFADARLVYGWNEPEEDGEAPGIGDDEALLVLGACEMPGTVYATRPVGAVALAKAGARDEKRVREEILRAGSGNAIDVVRVGDAVIGRGRVTPDRSLIENVLASYPEGMRGEMREAVDASAGPIDVFVLVSPALTEPLRIGEHMGFAAQSVILSAIVSIGGEDIALVVHSHDSIESSSAFTGSVILLRTGQRFDTTLAGSGC